MFHFRKNRQNRNWAGQNDVTLPNPLPQDINQSASVTNEDKSIIFVDDGGLPVHKNFFDRSGELGDVTLRNPRPDVILRAWQEEKNYSFGQARLPKAMPEIDDEVHANFMDNSGAVPVRQPTLPVSSLGIKKSLRQNFRSYDNRVQQSPETMQDEIYQPTRFSKRASQEIRGMGRSGSYTKPISERVMQQDNQWDGENPNDFSREQIGQLAAKEIKRILAQKPSIMGQDLKLGNGQLTLEVMVQEAMRPYLKTWIDHHLEDLVAEIVRRQVASLI